jgi:hypothetical protein
MRIGELLLAARLVSEDQISAAMGRQRREGGRLGHNLAAIEAISPERLEAFLAAVPAEPSSVAETGIDEKSLLELLLKTAFNTPAESLADFAHALKLMPKLVDDLLDLCVRGQLMSALGGGHAGARYELTEAGKRRAMEANARSAYVGAAPVSLESYTHWVSRQKVTNEQIDWPGMKRAFADLQVADAFVDQIGPAISSGRALLMYGPPGNGKTSVAQRLERVFQQIIYVPHAVLIDGQVMMVFDPDVHRPVNPAWGDPEASPSLYRDNADSRWVACWRPFIVTGGELTLEMLDLKHEATANLYTAPLHIKAAGGCLLIDDFGRQIVSPTALLNRWIVPLENRVDYLKLNTGKSFRIPFEAIVIFSTNLDPADLMDPAFLRRIPYKLEVRAPALEAYRRIFEAVAAANGLKAQLTHEVFHQIVTTLRDVHGLELAAFQPGFLIAQIVAACRFREVPPDFHPDMVDYAIANLAIGRSASAAPTLEKDAS